MSSIHRIAAVQMVSSADITGNFRQAAPLIVEAVERGAKLVLLPENFGFMGRHPTDKLAVRERDGDGPQQQFLAEAALRNRVTVIGGSVPLACDDPSRVKQSLLVYGPDGRRIARYDKIHLFRFTYGNEDYDEPRTISAGSEVVAIDAPWGRTGLSICYDVRFPELYRAMGGVSLIVVPSAFTVPTGEAHWEPLLRARAIENQCYVLAAAQGGAHPGGRRTWGHSMLIDPWGTIVTQHDDGPGVAAGDVDPSRIADVRARLPALASRVMIPPRAP